MIKAFQKEIFQTYRTLTRNAPPFPLEMLNSPCNKKEYIFYFFLNIKSGKTWLKTLGTLMKPTYYQPDLLYPTQPNWTGSYSLNEAFCLSPSPPKSKSRLVPLRLLSCDCDETLASVRCGFLRRPPSSKSRIH